MNRTLLVAKREYRQLTSTRAFRISLITLPLMFVVIGFVQSFLRPPDGSAFIILDRTGRYEAAIDRGVELNYQRQVVQQLAAYARRWHIEPRSAGALWGETGGRVLSEPEMDLFLTQGGLDAALDEIRPLLPPDASVFKPPARRFLSVPLPSGLAADGAPEALGAAIKPYLANKIETAVGRRPLALAVYIPDHVGEPGMPIRFWTNSGGNANDLITEVRGEITRELRLQTMQALGMDATAVARIQSIEAPIVVVAPPPGGGAGGVVLRSLLPMAFVYLLLITALISGSMLLQGVVEERSNKLLETVLSCISAAELMRGKLLGVGAVGLTLVAVWAGCAVAGVYAIPGDLADPLRPALASVHSPLMALGLIFYFLAGYLVMSMLFLAIGAMSDSMQDAQGYLMPVMMLFMLPVIVLMNSVILNPGGILPVIMSWIPLYTPFAMLARLNGGVSVFEVFGTGVLLIAFIAVELVLLGRVFRASLLRTGQPPRLGAMVKLMLARDTRS
jgi:ABC-2 type transport system permease protein